MESVVEVWRSVQETAYYEISDLGRVRSVPRTVPRGNGVYRVQHRILSIAKTPKGYCFVKLHAGDERLQRYVHHLVVEAFIGSRDGQEVNHKNGDKSDNRLVNLEIISKQENMRHARDTGLINIRGERNPCVKYTGDQIRHGYSLVASGMRYKEAAAIAGVNQDALEAACRGLNWKSLGLEPIYRSR